jgi:cysteinyl-tRNA synthetase
MQLKLYDTLTRKKRDFVPLDWERELPESERRVRMYVCGPTVYDFAHIGNARPVIVFDVLFRLLRHLYGNDRVVYVRNITDVDDKINARAAELRVPIRELTERTYRDFAEDVQALGCLPPTFEPRATEYIDDMKILIERLVASGHAYVAAEHVLFHVPSMPDYGQLSKRPLHQMIAGARVDVAPYKRHPMDFVLWKPSDERQTNYVLPKWQAPCEIRIPGRPGWHIECSAMAWKHLDVTFDIHGGGVDLIFPHHENEIAQTRCAFHTPFMARYWLHNGFLQIEGEKMAKSEGNTIRIRDLIEEWSGEVVRLAMLMSHYRQPMDWTRRRLVEAKDLYNRWMTMIAELPVSETWGPPDPRIINRLADDLNTPGALKVLSNIRDSIAHSHLGAANLARSLIFLGLLPHPSVVGEALDLAMKTVGAWERRTAEAFAKFSADAREATKFAGRVNMADLRVAARAIDFSELNDLIERRTAARKRGDFGEGDRIRNYLAGKGILLIDTKQGPKWEVAR